MRNKAATTSTYVAISVSVGWSGRRGRLKCTVYSRLKVRDIANRKVIFCIAMLRGISEFQRISMDFEWISKDFSKDFP